MADAAPITARAEAWHGLRLSSAPGIATVSGVGGVRRLLLRAAPDDAGTLARALGLRWPAGINRFELSASAIAVLQVGPDEWLIAEDVAGGDASGRSTTDADQAGDALLAALAAEARTMPVAHVDVSHRFASLAIDGSRVEDVLAAGCPLPLDAARFPVGRATRTLFHKAEIILWRTGPKSFRLEAGRSFVPYLAHHLEAAIRAEAALARHAENPE